MLRLIMERLYNIKKNSNANRRELREYMTRVTLQIRQTEQRASEINDIIHDVELLGARVDLVSKMINEEIGD